MIDGGGLSSRSEEAWKGESACRRSCCLPLECEAVASMSANDSSLCHGTVDSFYLDSISESRGSEDSRSASSSLFPSTTKGCLGGLRLEDASAWTSCGRNGELDMLM